MLTQYHPARAHHTAYDNGETEPPLGIEAEDNGKGQYGSGHTPDGCRMSGDFVPHVHRGAENLYHQCCYEDAAHEMGYMKQVHQIVAGEIAEDGEDVGHHAPLLYSELQGCPSLMAAVGVDEQGRGEHREDIDHQEHKELVECRKDAQIAEHEQGQQTQNGKIEGREHHADDTRRENDIFFFHNASVQS